MRHIFARQREQRETVGFDVVFADKCARGADKHKHVRARRTELQRIANEAGDCGDEGDDDKRRPGRSERRRRRAQPNGEGKAASDGREQTGAVQIGSISP